MYAFVYGSLRKNEQNHHFLEGASLISEQAWTSGELYSGSSYYPLLIKNEASLAYGELYEIDEGMLQQLDRLEGYREKDPASLFKRETSAVHTQQKSYSAYVYYYPHPPEGKPVLHRDWKVEQLLKKESYYYFAFGSCMDQERFYKSGVQNLFQEIEGGAELQGYHLGFSYHRADGGRADIIERSGDSVEGVVYNITGKALNYLFRREGVSNQVYRPVVVEVTLHNGPVVEALSFTVIHKKESLTPPLHYAREIHRGGRYYLSKNYMERLEQRLQHELPVNEFTKYLQQME
ncbi:gamma-glutamylcyclotransferase [Halobacillus sp. B29]|uniref:gamma-glutamylcyclotransferase n=1 Tax=Halobacillus sp. B29 TaxID=3457432 RepID=UPI003FCDEDD6